MIDDQVGVWHSFNCVTNLEPVFSWRQVFHLVTQIFGEHRLSRVLGHENVFFFKTISISDFSNFYLGRKWVQKYDYITQSYIRCCCPVDFSSELLYKVVQMIFHFILRPFLLHRGYRWRF